MNKTRHLLNISPLMTSHLLSIPVSIKLTAASGLLPMVILSNPVVKPKDQHIFSSQACVKKQLQYMRQFIAIRHQLTLACLPDLPHSAQNTLHLDFTLINMRVPSVLRLTMFNILVQFSFRFTKNHIL